MHTLPKRVIALSVAALLLAVVCLCAGIAASESAPLSPMEAVRTTALPEGVWIRAHGEQWVFMFQAPVSLDDAQKEIATASGLPMENGVLLAGATVSPDQLTLLFPDAEGVDSPPLPIPNLVPFELTGDWYYGDDGVLYYRHDQHSAVLTMDQVFAAINGTASVESGGEKAIYLTIDDAPTVYTMELLATLDRLGVKATFFVVGAYVKQRPVFVRAIHQQGHGIANHTYSHNSRILNLSYESLRNDIRRTERQVEAALGFSLPMPIVRIPYGSATIPPAFRAQLEKDGYLWIDWNALNGDTEKHITSDEMALERAFDTASRRDGPIVMLVHDGKKRTIRILPALVEHFRAEGYQFRVLDVSVGEIPGVRMGLPATK